MWLLIVFKCLCCGCLLIIWYIQYSIVNEHCSLRNCWAVTLLCSLWTPRFEHASVRWGLFTQWVLSHILSGCVWLSFVSTWCDLWSDCFFVSYFYRDRISVVWTQSVRKLRDLITNPATSFAFKAPEDSGMGCDHKSTAALRQPMSPELLRLLTFSCCNGFDQV